MLFNRQNRAWGQPVVILILLLLVGLGGVALRSQLSLNLAHLMLMHSLLANTPEGAIVGLKDAAAWGQAAGIRWEEADQPGTNVKLRLARVTNEESTRLRYAAQLYAQAVEREAQGEPSAALALYQQAYMQTAQTASTIAVFRLASQLNQPALMQKMRDRLSQAKPTFDAHNTEALGHVVLRGYDLDELALEQAAGPVRVTLYWQSDTTFSQLALSQMNDWTYLTAGDTIYQVGTCQNILPNGGFELDLRAGALLPYGYQNTAYAARDDAAFVYAQHRVLFEQRGDALSQVALLLPPRLSMNGLTTMASVAVQPKQWYFFAGLMRVGDQGRGSLGGAWRTSQERNLAYWYLVRDQAAHDWQSFAGVALVPEGASHFTLLAFNRGGGNIAFDNFLLCQVPLWNE